MQIETSINGDKAVIAVSGKLTVATSPELEAAIQQVDGTDTVSSYDIDLTGLEYISSAGLRVLVGAQKLVDTKGGALRLLHPSDDVMEILKMTGLSDVLTIER